MYFYYFLCCSLALFAHLSANSLPSSRLCPRTQTSLALLCRYSGHTTSTISRFFISPPFFFHPFFSQVNDHLVMTLIQNSLSVYISQSEPCASFSAAIMANPSIRIL